MSYMNEEWGKVISFPKLYLSVLCIFLSSADVFLWLLLVSYYQSTEESGCGAHMVPCLSWLRNGSQACETASDMI